MIQVIAGNKGSGKTKRLIDMTNKASQESHHDIVFIDDDNRYMFDLRHEIRFVNAGEYGMVGPEMFYGFLCGMLAQNFDVTVVFIDAFLKLVNVKPNETEWFFKNLESLGEKRNLTFILSVGCDDSDAPEYIRKHFI